MTIQDTSIARLEAVAVGAGVVGPYSPAVRAANGTIYVSGQLPLRPDGTIAVDAEPTEQLRLCIENAFGILAAAGSTPAEIVRAVIYTTSLSAAAELNETYERLFGNWLPARSMIEVAGLPKGASVEVELTAVSVAPAESTPIDAVAALQAATPAAQRIVYGNTGTAGPPLKVALEALEDAAKLDWTLPRTSMDRFGMVMADAARAREAIGAMLGASGSHIALTHNTTEGVNIVTWGLDWRPGDRVLTTDIEHMGGLAPLYELHQRFGVEVDFVSLADAAPEAVPELIAGALTERTRLFAFSHVAYSTGARYPLAEIVTVCHENGTLVAADGAQSFAAMSLDVPATGVDFYAVPGQKWLCGPEGTGALYVAEGMLEVLKPTFVGFFGADYEAYAIGDPESLKPAAGAQRYEVGSVYHPGLAAMAAAAEWHLAQGASITDRIHALAEHARAVFDALEGVEVITPSAHAGLVSMRLVKDIDEAVAYLGERGIDVRSVHDNDTLRVSTGFYLTEGDIEHVATTLAEFLGD